MTNKATEMFDAFKAGYEAVTDINIDSRLEDIDVAEALFEDMEYHWTMLHHELDGIIKAERSIRADG